MFAVGARVHPVCGAGGVAGGRRAGAGVARRGDGAATGGRGVAVGIELRRCNALGRRERTVNEIGPNFIARPYRGVSVQDVATLEDEALLAHVRGRRVYRRTEFIVATCGDERALVQVEREDEDGILVGVRDARILARPDEIAFVDDESVDTGNASQLARVGEGPPRDRRAGALPARELHLRAGAAADPRAGGGAAAPAEAARDGAGGARLRRGPAAGRARLRGDRHARARARAPGRSTTCSPAAAPGWTSTRRSTSSTPARRTSPTGRWSAASGRARSTRRCTAATRSERVDFCPRLTPANGAPTLLKCCLRERGIEQQDNRLDGALGREPGGGPRGAAPAGGGVKDSVVYGHLWGTPETRALFSDEGRTRIWLEIIKALAAEQAELDLIPAEAARQIAALELPDLEAVGEQTRATGHSTLGLIRVLRESLGPEGGEWVYYGATVQDVTDTWFGLVMQRMLAIARRDLTAIERSLHALADEHRDTVMLGRTHGQPGLPITFGFKAAGWADEVRRHLAARRGGGAAARGRPARRRRRHAVGVRRARRRAAAAAAGAARASACPEHELADGARPDRRVHRRCWRWSPARWRRSATRSTTSSVPRSASCPRRRPRAWSAASRCRRSATPSAPSTS